MIESGDLLFQSSRDGFETIADLDIANEILPYALAQEERKTVVSENYVTAGMCVRFRLNDFKTKFPEYKSKKLLNTFIAHVCPFRDEVRLHLPKTAANDISEYQSLTTLVLNQIADPNFGIRSNTYVKIKEIIIRHTEVCQSFTLDGKYQMFIRGDAVQINDTTFKQCYDGSIWSLSGHGKETILHAKADVQVITKGSRFGINGTLNIFDAEILQNRTGECYLHTKFHTPLSNLMTFPMSNLRFEIFFKKRNKLL